MPHPRSARTTDSRQYHHQRYRCPAHLRTDALAGIEQRHGLADGRLRHILHERPTARAACIGLLDQQTWLNHARHALPPTAIDEWLNYHGMPNQRVIDLLHRARQDGCRILLLTDSTRRRYDDLAHHHFTDLAEGIYLSTDIGYAKPDPYAWAYVLRHSRADPACTMSIDPLAAWANASRESGRLTHTLAHAGEVADVAWSPDGGRLASAGADATRIWDGPSGAGVHTVASAHIMAWSPVGSHLATVSGDTVQIWDAATGQAVHTLAGHALGIADLEWSPDGTRLATAGDDWTARVWDATTGQLAQGEPFWQV